MKCRMCGIVALFCADQIEARVFCGKGFIWGREHSGGGNVAMKSQRIVMLLAAWFVLFSASGIEAQKIKVIVDQDARGPATTDMQSILIFLQSDKFDVLGVTTVSGDQW